MPSTEQVCVLTSSPKFASGEVYKHTSCYDRPVQLDLAETLEDLRVPPGDRLEKLSGHRAGQHSIRINRQYRVCFVWEDGDVYEVEVTDYHYSVLQW